MPDIVDLFPHLRDWDTSALLARRQDLKVLPTGATGLSDEALQELVCISRILRIRQSVTRPKTEGAAPKRTIPSLDML